MPAASFPTGTVAGTLSRQHQRDCAVTFKDFGVSLGFTPVVLSEGRINLKINTEVSELSRSQCQWHSRLRYTQRRNRH